MREDRRRRGKAVRRTHCATPRAGRHLGSNSERLKMTTRAIKRVLIGDAIVDTMPPIFYITVEYTDGTTKGPGGIDAVTWWRYYRDSLPPGMRSYLEKELSDEDRREPH